MNKNGLFFTLVFCIFALLSLFRANTVAAEEIFIFEDRFNSGWIAWTWGAEALTIESRIDVRTTAPESGLFIEHPKWWANYLTLEEDDQLHFDLHSIDTSHPNLGVSLMRIDGSRTRSVTLTHSDSQTQHAIALSEFLAEGEEIIYLRAILFENLNKTIVRSDFSLSHIYIDQGETVLTPPSPSNACGPLSQEAETGLLSGNLIATVDGFLAAGDTIDETINPNNSAIFCVEAAETAAYYLNASIKAPTDASDSIYVSINGETFIWQAVAGTGSYALDYLTDRQDGELGGDFIPLRLNVGPNSVIFYNREPGIEIDRFEFALVPDLPIPDAYSPSSHSPTALYDIHFDAAVKESSNTIASLPIDHWIEFGDIDGSSGGAWFDIRDEAYAGDHSLYLELFDISKSRRAELNVWLDDSISANEFTFSAWYKLPADFQIEGDGRDGYWFEMISLLSEYDAESGFNHYYALHLDQDLRDPNFVHLNLFRRSSLNCNEPEVVDVFENYPLPRGEWFNVTYYIKRDSVNGAIKLWIDGELVLTAENISTHSRDAWKSIPAKIYYPQSDTLPKHLFIDELKIFAGYHPPDPIKRE